ncbi:MAG: 50S ribosomal protein L25 [Ignavibacteriae bacterium HGW-Ignavibacteriae-4]|jgi:large subunit ribosomal protein L25|nr:MAG: 50S ribosomal protein L25 [Ignavibacteriae bacterium HGW-Ignavibacteriae-4]
MASIQLKVAKRDAKNTKVSDVRRQGFIPGVYYINGTESVPITSNFKDLKSIVFTSLTNVVDLEIDGEENRKCILKEVKFDPITDEILHFDLMGLTPGNKIVVNIPITLIGQSVGVRNGGILNHVLRKVKVRCLPKDLVETIEVDISKLKIGKLIKLDEIDLGDLEVVVKGNAVIAGVSRPRVATAGTTIEMDDDEDEDSIGEEGAATEGGEGEAGE